MAHGDIGACGQDWLKLDCYIEFYIPAFIVFLDYKKITLIVSETVKDATFEGLCMHRGRHSNT